MAIGLPCVTTSCATEGAQLPSLLLETVTDRPVEFAARIIACHDDPDVNAAAAAAGLNYVRTNGSEMRIDALLSDTLDGVAMRKHSTANVEPQLR
jgi:hypothetical protein